MDATVMLSFGEYAGVSRKAMLACGGRSYSSSNPPVHVARLRADPRLSSINAGVVNDGGDVLVSIPNLDYKTTRRYRVTEETR